MPEISKVCVSARRNADYREVWDTSRFLPGSTGLAGWYGLKMSLCLEGTDTVVLTLNQVTSAAEGLVVLDPAAALIEIYVAWSTLTGIPDDTGEVVLAGDLAGFDPEGARRVICDVEVHLSDGVTAL